MKKYLILTLLFFIPLSLSASIEQADKHYREGRFVHALEEYEGALKNYPQNPYLYYNIGNCYFKLDMTGRAIAFYRRAFELNPGDPSIRHNLNLALNKTGQSLIDEGMPEGMHRAFYFLPLAQLRGLVFISFWVLCLYGAFVLWKKPGNFLLIVFSIIFAIFGSWYFIRNGIENEDYAVITVPMAELHSGPGLNFEASAAIPEGFSVIINDVKDDWYLVLSNSNNEVEGWIQKDSLARLKEI